MTTPLKIISVSHRERTLSAKHNEITDCSHPSTEKERGREIERERERESRASRATNDLAPP